MYSLEVDYSGEIDIKLSRSRKLFNIGLYSVLPYGVIVQKPIHYVGTYVPLNRYYGTIYYSKQVKDERYAICGVHFGIDKIEMGISVEPSYQITIPEIIY